MTPYLFAPEPIGTDPTESLLTSPLGEMSSCGREPETRTSRWDWGRRCVLVMDGSSWLPEPKYYSPKRVKRPADPEQAACRATTVGPAG
jgi:hypothetical protein